MKRTGRILVYSCFGLLGAFFVAFDLYVSAYYPAHDVEASLVSDKTVEVLSEGETLVFKPKTAWRGSAIFYPGGKVDETAYAPLCHAYAEKGIEMHLLKMPFRLAVFDVEAGARVMALHPEVAKWGLVGHSLGGAMAASFAKRHLPQIQGMVFLASYSSEDLTTSESLKTATVYGSNDGVMNRGKYQSNLANLPASNHESVLKGGNHSGFAYYGKQQGDGEATLSKDEQIRQAVEASEAELTD